MKSNLTYTGKVVATLKSNGKTLSQTYYNNGMDLLFEAYARALAGQSITDKLPAYIDVGYRDPSSTNPKQFTSHLKTPASAIRTFVSKHNDKIEGYNYGQPFTRVEALLSKSIFTNSIQADGATPTNALVLRPTTGADDDILAMVSAPTFAQLVKEMPMGAQLIIVWDLYVENKSYVAPQSND